jgi:hypothetical protein
MLEGLPMITLDVTFHRRLVRATVGDLIRVDLPEDAMAGRRWVLPEALPAELRLVKDKTESASGKERRLELRVVRKGRTRLCLQRGSGWTAEESFEVYIDARTDSDATLDDSPPSSRRGLDVTPGSRRGADVAQGSRRGVEAAPGSRRSHERRLPRRGL